MISGLLIAFGWDNFSWNSHGEEHAMSGILTSQKGKTQISYRQGHCQYEVATVSEHPHQKTVATISKRHYHAGRAL